MEDRWDALSCFASPRSTWTEQSSLQAAPRSQELIPSRVANFCNESRRAEALRPLFVAMINVLQQ